ncbi:shikimate dehydrogenase [Microbacterium sp. W1N]|uniref:shikimate dehydrogenase family protein n=1 Tax=Microbacterium festucae TaxID=2977531 RepID=UPI0021BF7E20|nr:shikimate dehydrogenase [Microbacterium festucae]MCT9820118.1 shikimate dehydrogenase [Microbacterium festucae]
MTATALEVWGDPIAHSLSPVLHGAAYRHLGWDWTYGRRRVDERSFAAELAGLDATYRGLSCTMPLKGVAHDAAVWRDDRAAATGAANTLLLGADGPRAWNTDVGGIVRALADEGITDAETVRIVGAGATATSALAACAELGTRHVDIVARRPDAAASLQQLGERLGLAVTASALSGAAAAHRPAALTLSTLPGAAELPAEVADGLAAGGGLLFDVVYGHWPTALAEAWQRAGHRAVPGTGMLLHQAVLQIRVFATGDVSQALPDETAVVDVMRRALVGG